MFRLARFLLTASLVLVGLSALAFAQYQDEIPTTPSDPFGDDLRMTPRVPQDRPPSTKELLPASPDSMFGRPAPAMHTIRRGSDDTMGADLMHHAGELATLERNASPGGCTACQTGCNDKACGCGGGRSNPRQDCNSCSACQDSANSCGDCDNCGCGCGAAGGWTAAPINPCGSFCGGISATVEATYLQPTILAGFGSDSQDPFFSPLTHDFGYEAAPRVVLAAESPTGWGIRGRYWQVDALDDFQFVSSMNDRFTVVSLHASVEAYTIDFELTRRFALGEWCIQSSLGARHASMHRRQVFTLSTLDYQGGGGDDASSLLARISRQLNGTGLTLGLDGRRPLGSTSLALVGGLRGSVVWGRNAAHQQLAFAEVVPAGVGDLNVADMQGFNGAFSVDDAMFIGELQAGVEWSQPCDALCGAVFMRSLFEAQWWSYDGFNIGLGSADPESIQFLGATFAVGFTR
jgi:hypothetical protein